MKGVILAGGTGSRLHPCTQVTNKHLLPVYNKPMVFHPLETLKSLGVREILIVTGGECIGDFMRLLGSGSSLGVSLTYRIQDGALGIAHALSLAEDFAKSGSHIAVILGDNIFEKVSLPEDLKRDEALIFIKEVDDPERFGVVTFDKDKKVIEIEEKPKKPKSRYAVTGLYIYPLDVFDFIRTLKPSHRGELEITDVNNYYVKRNRMKAIELKGFWGDAGTFQSLHKASTFVREREERN